MTTTPPNIRSRISRISESQPRWEPRDGSSDPPKPPPEPCFPAQCPYKVTARSKTRPCQPSSRSKQRQARAHALEPPRITLTEAGLLTYANLKHLWLGVLCKRPAAITNPGITLVRPPLSSTAPILPTQPQLFQSPPQPGTQPLKGSCCPQPCSTAGRGSRGPDLIPSAKGEAWAAEQERLVQGHPGGKQPP